MQYKSIHMYIPSEEPRGGAVQHTRTCIWIIFQVYRYSSYKLASVCRYESLHSSDQQRRILGSVFTRLCPRVRLCAIDDFQRELSLCKLFYKNHIHHRSNVLLFLSMNTAVLYVRHIPFFYFCITKAAACSVKAATEWTKMEYFWYLTILDQKEKKNLSTAGGLAEI